MAKEWRMTKNNQVAHEIFKSYKDGFLNNDGIRRLLIDHLVL